MPHLMPKYLKFGLTGYNFSKKKIEISPLQDHNFWKKNIILSNDQYFTFYHVQWPGLDKIF